MSPRLLSVLILASALLAWPLAAGAQDSSEEESGEGESSDDSADSGGEDEGEGEDPNIRRDDDDEEWTFDGIVDPEPEPEPEPDAESTRPAQPELPPEPSRYGISGNWYEVPITCATCDTLLGQGFEVEGAEIMRRYFEHLVVERDRRTGKVVYPTRGENRPVSVSASGRSVRICMHVQEPSRRRSTDTFAHVWDLELGPDDEILYGRRYRVETANEAAYETLGEGYRASTSHLSASRLFGTAELAPVQQLSLENPQFAFTEDATIVFVGLMALVRSDYNGAGVATRQAELQAEADAAAELARQQEEAMLAGNRAYEAGELELAVTRYDEAIALGLTEDPNMRFQLGAAHQQLRNYDEAVAQYRWLLEHNPRDTDVRFNLGRVLERRGEYQEALEQYETNLKYDANDIDAEDRIVQVRRRLEN